MKKILFFALLTILTGCFSTPNSRFYLLESAHEQSMISARKIDVAVADVQVPDYLQKPQIILQKQDTPELKIAEFDRWASDLSGMLQNTLIEDLQKAFPNAEIKTLLYGNTPKYIIKVNIEKMNGWLGHEAVLSGTWQIIDPRGLFLAGENFSLNTPAGKTYASYVAAQSKMWMDVANQISKRLVGF